MSSCSRIAWDSTHARPPDLKHCKQSSVLLWPPQSLSVTHCDFSKADAREKRKEERKLQRWKDAGYVSSSVAMTDDEPDDVSDDTEYMHYVSGDVTQPVTVPDESVLVTHVVDDSGDWGSGGVFDALGKVTSRPKEQYELAGDMKDIKLGDVHVVDCNDMQNNDKYSVALLIAQDQKLKMKTACLKDCLRKLSTVAAGHGYSVHLPRIGYNSPGFDWYGTERLLRKYLANKGIHTYIYYYPRRKRRRDSGENVPSNKKARAESPGLSDVPAGGSSVKVTSDGPLENILTGLDFMIDNSIPALERAQLRRYIIAFNGNIVSCETENTNYIVTIEPTDHTESAVEVKPEFVFESIKSRSICPASDFLID